MTGLDDSSSILRGQGATSRVTFIELFFDLVYVLAVTQLTDVLLGQLTAVGVAQTGVLLLAVWWAWVDTAWLTNWFDPNRTVVRLLLVAMMGTSLILSASLPEAYGDRGLWFAGSYVMIQVGRSLFGVVALGARSTLLRNFQRILCWRLCSGVFWLSGGLAHGSVRLSLWAAAAVIDTTAAAAGFYLPKIGGTPTSQWQIRGDHLAERSRLFLIIALGESILITGSVFGGMPPDLATLTAFATAFLGTVALWWIYFDRSAAAANEVITGSEDPGRLGRSAYTYLHIPMVAGIIVTAVGDDLTLRHPTEDAAPAAIATILGGPALFLAGYTLFKKTIFGVRSVTHLVAIAILVALAPLGLLLSPLAISAAATLVVAASAAWHSIAARRNPPPSG